MWYECRIGGYPDDWKNNMSWEQYIKLVEFFKLKAEKDKKEAGD